MIGWVLIVLGSGFGIIGGIINAINYHDAAIDVWTISNFLLVLWAIGFIKGWWNKKISVEALVLMYAVFTVCNIYAIIMR